MEIDPLAPIRVRVYFITNPVELLFCISVKRVLAIWEGKVWRRIFGGKGDGEIWMSKTSQELSELYGEANIMVVVKTQKLK